MPDFPSNLRKLIDNALREDAAFHDITTRALVPKKLQARAVVLAKQDLIVCGMPALRETFRRLDSKVKVRVKVPEGKKARKGTVLAEVSGSARALLSGERVALNFLQRLSGIATLTHRFVTALRGTRAKLLDTRKTTPGLRLLERYAVKVGGGMNHRFDLSDAAMAKDNHLAIAGSVSEVMKRLARLRGRQQVIVEVKSLAELQAALEAGARRVLLDNMPVATLRRAVKLARGRCHLEASGGVTLGNIRAIARAGVDFISVGALTHSVPAVDISLEILPFPIRI